MIATDGSEFMASLRSPFSLESAIKTQAEMGHDLILNTFKYYQPVLRPDGKLLNASQIEWFHDPNDPHPMRPPFHKVWYQYSSVIF
jgi:hypothetical protein